MGVKELWSILKDAKEDKKLADFRGEKLAVDFGGWVVECTAAANNFSSRALFFRILNLMSHGITPVFVFDSAEAIEIKERKRGVEYFRSTQQWEELLKVMGFPVMRAEGEAEKICAQLNASKIVHGVITDDGDAFAYGATKVLKDYVTNTTKKKMIHVYDSSNFKTSKGQSFGQMEIIVAAILVGCDYYKGVPKVGIEMFQKLIEEWDRNGITDVLDRMRTWKTNHGLLSLVDDKKKISMMKKKPHCSQCGHLGTIRQHEKDGCGTAPIPCPCEYHTLTDGIKQCSVELEVREKALALPNFPPEKVISEFLMRDEAFDKGIEFTVKKPDYTRVFEMLKEQFKLGNDDIKNFFPALVKMILYGQETDFEAVLPVGNSKECKWKGELCYEVKFPRFGFDTISPQDETGYDIKVVRSVLKSKFPDLAPEEKQKPKGTKNPKKEQKPIFKEGEEDAPKPSTSKRCKIKEDPEQPKMTSYFPKKKKDEDALRSKITS